MSILEAWFLGFVQGITEFLPISSTAHIVIASTVLGVSFPGLTMEVYLHLASVAAVMLYFRRDLIQISSAFVRTIYCSICGKWDDRADNDKPLFAFGVYLLLGTLITGVLGMLVKDIVADSMKTPPVIALALVVTGIVLIFIERFHTEGTKTETTMTWRDTVVVAIGQSVSVLPGISRSGSTLVAALWTGLKRETAVRFSFLLAIPVILGSTVLMIEDIGQLIDHDIGWQPMLIAFISAFLFTLVGIIWLIDFLKKRRLIYFAVYCFILAILVYGFLDPSVVMESEKTGIPLS